MNDVQVGESPLSRVGRAEVGRESRTLGVTNATCHPDRQRQTETPTLVRRTGDGTVSSPVLPVFFPFRLTGGDGYRHYSFLPSLYTSLSSKQVPVIPHVWNLWWIGFGNKQIRSFHGTRGRHTTTNSYMFKRSTPVFSGLRPLSNE